MKLEALLIFLVNLQKRSVENVMTLEMADFEKTVERLQKELKAATDEKLSMRSELEASMKDLENGREERSHLTSNITKLKAALRKMRNEIEGKILIDTQFPIRAPTSSWYGSTSNLDSVEKIWELEGTAKLRYIFFPARPERCKSLPECVSDWYSS